MNEQTLFEIYYLSDPRDESVRYVGMSKDAKKRLRQHRDSREKNLDKVNWLQELSSLHLQPALTIIETIQGRDAAREREAYWIDAYLEQGHPLTNRPNVIQEMWANFDYDTRTTIADPSQYVDVRRLRKSREAQS